MRVNRLNIFVFLLLILLSAGCREKYGPTQSSNAGYIVSDRSADIPVPIVITSPSPGEVFETGASLPIVWQSRTANTFLKIELFKGNEPLTKIATGVFPNQSINWTIPRTVISSADYRIKITDQNNNEIVGLSQFFIIRQLDVQ